MQLPINANAVFVNDVLKMLYFLRKEFAFVTSQTNAYVANTL